MRDKLLQGESRSEWEERSTQRLKAQKENVMEISEELKAAELKRMEAETERLLAEKERLLADAALLRAQRDALQGEK